jgi:hypothetical protein
LEKENVERKLKLSWKNKFKKGAGKSSYGVSMKENEKIEKCKKMKMFGKQQQ